MAIDSPTAVETCGYRSWRDVEKSRPVSARLRNAPGRRLKSLSPTIKLSNHRMFLATSCLVAGLVAVIARFVLFRNLSYNHDEVTYLLQADALRSGRFTVPSPSAAFADRYLPWFMYPRGDSFVPKYTPVLAGVLAIGRTVTFSYAIALGVLAASAMWCVVSFARPFLSPTALGWSVVALLVSPFWWLQSASVLPYLLFITTLLGAMLCLRVAESRATLRGASGALLGAGLLLGLSLWNRPWDGVLVLASLGPWWIVREVRARRRTVGQIASRAAVIGGGLGVVAVAIGWYNARYTGSVTRLPFTEFNPRDTLGFGRRNQIPGEKTRLFTMSKGIDGQLSGLQRLVPFLGGAIAGVALAFVGLLKLSDQRRGHNATESDSTDQQISQAVIGQGQVRPDLGWLGAYAVVSAALLVGYAFVWSGWNAHLLWDGSQFLGPFYLLHLVPLVAWLTGIGIASLTRTQRNVALALCVLCGAWTTSTIVGRNLKYGDRAERIAARLAKVPEDAIVYYNDGPPRVYTGHPETVVRNRVDGRGRRFILGGSSTRGMAALVEASRSSQRSIWLGQPTKTGPLFSPQELRTAKAFDVTMSVNVPSNATTLVARIGEAKSVSTFLLSTSPKPGEQTMTFSISDELVSVNGLDPFTRSPEFGTIDRPLRLIVATGRPDGREVVTEVRLPYSLNADSGRYRFLTPGHLQSSPRWPGRAMRPEPGPHRLKIVSVVTS